MDLRITHALRRNNVLRNNRLRKHLMSFAAAIAIAFWAIDSDSTPDTWLDSLVSNTNPWSILPITGSWRPLDTLDFGNLWTHYVTNTCYKIRVVAS